ncbi:putative deoxyribonuclease TATDN3 [Corticium candelabrum]|uniref:putative deoxyribonuclease TATDN3 n=1 Tax=Corticium candelabrum TaxID=121492 RepID=UPI002E26DEE8|nr:putative deoxyribonuclease TATDN3 [Corticium candelabrum]
MVDIHAHLAAEDFNHDLEDVLARAASANISTIVVVPEFLSEFDKVLELSERHRDLVAPCLGLHPVQSDASTRNERSVTTEEVLPVLDFIRREHSKIVGIGEVGLDFTPRFVKSDDDKAAQRYVLTEQAKLAMDLGLPLNVHSRSAGRPTLQLLKSLGVRNAVMHAFDGKASVAMEGVHVGYFFSIPPSVVRSEQKQKLVRQVPLDHLLLETDSPALGPIKQTRNEPCNLEISCREVARIKQVSFDEVWKMTTQNAVRLFPKLGHVGRQLVPVPNAK